MADPISDLWNLLTTNFVCMMGAIAFGILILVAIVVLHIRKIQKESAWAYNPDKHLKLRWRRGRKQRGGLPCLRGVDVDADEGARMPRQRTEHATPAAACVQHLIRRPEVAPRPRQLRVGPSSEARVGGAEAQKHRTRAVDTLIQIPLSFPSMSRWQIWPAEMH